MFLGALPDTPKDKTARYLCPMKHILTLLAVIATLTFAACAHHNSATMQSTNTGHTTYSK